MRMQGVLAGAVHTYNQHMVSRCTGKQFQLVLSLQQDGHTLNKQNVSGGLSLGHD